MAKTLATLRRAAGYRTQESLSSDLGIGRTMIAKWETGARYPRSPMLPKLAELLNTTEGEIIASIIAARK